MSKAKKVKTPASKHPYKIVARQSKKSKKPSSAPTVPEIELDEHGACPFWGFSSDKFKMIRMGLTPLKPDFINLFEEKMAADKRSFTKGTAIIYVMFSYLPITNISLYEVFFFKS